jgi:hypothetical protein
MFSPIIAKAAYEYHSSKLVLQTICFPFSLQFVNTWFCQLHMLLTAETLILTSMNYSNNFDMNSVFPINISRYLYSNFNNCTSLYLSKKLCPFSVVVYIADIAISFLCLMSWRDIREGIYRLIWM